MSRTEKEAATPIQPAHTPELFEEAVEKAASLLQAGAVVALPTETVYGLAANALDEGAVGRIFEIKGRPPHNPLIVHVASLAMAKEVVAHWPSMADRLAAAFWPGPLTLVLPRRSHIPDRVTGGGPTVGVRWPSHPLMQAVIQRCGLPLAAPSANPANRLSPTNARHVRDGLDSRVALIVDGGQSQVGIESTVLDLTPSIPRLLRPGIIPIDALQAIIGEIAAPAVAPSAPQDRSPLRSPGQLGRHYSPQTPLVLWSWSDESALRDRLHHRGHSPEEVAVIAYSQIPFRYPYARVSVMPNDPEAFARALFSELHSCDELAPALIVVEHPPETASWQGVVDRLRRAGSE